MSADRDQTDSDLVSRQNSGTGVRHAARYGEWVCVAVAIDQRRSGRQSTPMDDFVVPRRCEINFLAFHFKRICQSSRVCRTRYRLPISLSGRAHPL